MPCVAVFSSNCRACSTFMMRHCRNMPHANCWVPKTPLVVIQSSGAGSMMRDRASGPRQSGSHPILVASDATAAQAAASSSAIQSTAPRSPKRGLAVRSAPMLSNALTTCAPNTHRATCSVPLFCVPCAMRTPVGDAGHRGAVPMGSRLPHRSRSERTPPQSTRRAWLEGRRHRRYECSGIGNSIEDGRGNALTDRARTARRVSACPPPRSRASWAVSKAVSVVAVLPSGPI